MNNMTRRDFLSVSAVGIGGLVIGNPWQAAAQSGSAGAAIEKLYQRFREPERRYSIRPFWFWNGDMDGAELGRQIRQMVEHGVYGAYAHNRDGLTTPYLSEKWWQVVGEALKAAKDAGFDLCMVDEFEWPSGEARDYWLPTVNKSRVVAANPDFQMHRLHQVETPVKGSRRVSIPLPERPGAVVVARRLGPYILDGETLKALACPPNAREISWDAPEGEWIVFTYGIEPVIGQPDHGTVDLMSKEAVAKYIEIYYEEFYRRHGEYFGNALPATFADHEGTYGSKLPWTPDLLSTFQRKAGYDLVPHLPALTYDVGPKTEKIRCDLLDTVSELYSDNFFQQVTDWCHAHKLEHSGHIWEESLYFGPSVQGDYYRVLRSMTNPGCDTLVEWGRQSVWLKELASIAEFEGRRVVCENQGVQGESSDLSPEGMRRVSNCLGAWDVGEFIPHAFDYDLSRINFPPDWFRSQPYLPWFRAYADQMRRISLMNVESRLVADILLYYPQVSIWGQSAPAFRTEDFDLLLKDTTWSENATETNFQFAELKMRLSENRLDYLVADDYYMEKSQVANRQLKIANSSFTTLILPPMTTIRRSTAERVRSFYQAGGTVIALRRLPTISTESGRDDTALKEIWNNTFDGQATLQPYQLRKNSAGGRAYFVPGSVADLLELLNQISEPDARVVEGPVDHLYVMHKHSDGTHFYWVVNDTAEQRTYLLRLRAKGRPERWEAYTGKRAPLFYQTDSEHTNVRLKLGPWDAAYVVFDAEGPAQPFSLEATNLDDLYVLNPGGQDLRVRGRAVLKGTPLSVTLSNGQQRFKGEYKPKSIAPMEITGNWRVTVEAPEIPQPHVQVLDDPNDQGLRGRWYAQPENLLNWSTLWLSPMNQSIRDWNVIGPFPNPGDHGLDETYPPEEKTDYEVVYTGEEDRRIGWKKISSADYVEAPKRGAWSLGILNVEGGPYAADANIVNYGKPLREFPLKGTFFAQTNVYSPADTKAVVVLASPTPTAVFLNQKKVYSNWVRPLYYELTDGFAAHVPIELRSGWNSLLLKFLHNPVDPKSGHFTCRVQSPDGTPIQKLISSSRSLANPELGMPRGYRWLRLAVPALAKSLRVPAFSYPWAAFVDESKVGTASEIVLPRGTRHVTLRVSTMEILDHPFAFIPTAANLPLGTWKVPGLENFSGQITYEKSLEVPQAFLGERVLLDCGDVGVCAEAWVNGKPAGTRPWAPYIFDVSEHLRAGSNQLKVRVANTAANARAVGPSRHILENIHVDGWHGPAHLVPYAEAEIQCERL